MSDSTTFVTSVNAICIGARSGATAADADLSVALAAIVQLTYFMTTMLLVARESRLSMWDQDGCGGWFVLGSGWRIGVALRHH